MLNTRKRGRLKSIFQTAFTKQKSGKVSHLASFPRRRESRPVGMGICWVSYINYTFWIPACAGMAGFDKQLYQNR